MFASKIRSLLIFGRHASSHSGVKRLEGKTKERSDLSRLTFDAAPYQFESVVINSINFSVGA